jgi:hypothetical protein
MMSACHPESQRSQREGPYVGGTPNMQWMGNPMLYAVWRFPSTASRLQES